MSYADRYDPEEDFDRWYTIATARAILAWLQPGQAVLELGCATGLMTSMFVEVGASVVGVDHAVAYLDRARGRRLARTELVESDIVAVDLGRTFDHVVVANVVHEVPDPGALFSTAARHAGAGGLVHVSLQNPRSIHRLVGLEMGLIAGLDELSERGRSLDTVAVLDVDELVALGADAGLELRHRSGVMLKPLPNDLMAGLPEPMLEGFIAAAHHLPEHAAMNYLVFAARRRADD
jgi:2-polyprenyl-3-methyl-5-hydroxy-6-metoxy-1,4-benzoquinol methylase